MTRSIIHLSAECKAGDEIRVEYAHRPWVRPTIALTGTYNFGVEAMAWPTGSSVGDLVVMAIMQGPNDSLANMNGWKYVGHSAYVSHATNSAVWSYRLVVIAKVRQEDDVFPTRNDGQGQSVMLGASFSGASRVSGAAFDTLADDNTAATPAHPRAQIRIWGTVSASTEITPASGTVLGNVGPLWDQDIDLCMTLDTAVSEVNASVNAGKTAGWCLATLAVDK